MPLHAVFTMTNSAAGNNVLVYNRAPASGMLTLVANVSTNDLGTGALLGSQGSLVLSNDSHWLIVSNAGSNNVSVFRVNAQGISPSIHLTSVTGSQGVSPISVTMHGNVVYVLNAGATGAASSIAGFHITPTGKLVPIPNSVKFLSGMNSPAEISFNPSGHVLVVTEKATNNIDTSSSTERVLHQNLHHFHRTGQRHLVLQSTTGDGS